MEACVKPFLLLVCFVLSFLQTIADPYLKENCIKKRRDIRWEPTPGKYLLCICTTGQTSNRLACLQRQMMDAALLNRTLIFPSAGVSYDYESLLDLEQPSVCFGNNRFITLKEYFQNNPDLHGVLKVDRFICFQVKNFGDYCSHLIKFLARINIKFIRTETPDEVMDTTTSGNLTKEEFRLKYSLADSIIAFGSVWGVSEFKADRDLIVSEDCKDYISPSKVAMELAKGFIKSYLGPHFMAVHLRRGDFYSFCQLRNLSCFYPIQQIAECLSGDLGASVKPVFLATNGRRYEITMLRSMLNTILGRAVTIVEMPSLEDMGEWADPLKEIPEKQKLTVISIVEKAICALSEEFHGSLDSTFSRDIYRLRSSYKMNICKDGNICRTLEVHS